MARLIALALALVLATGCTVQEGPCATGHWDRVATDGTWTAVAGKVAEHAYWAGTIQSWNKSLDYMEALSLARAAVDIGEEHGVETRLVLAVAWQESRFRDKAVSPMGAVGVMQVLPSTADWLAGKMGLSKYVLTDTWTSVRLGTFLLSRLSVKYDGDMDLVLSAYNGGGRAAAKYRKYRAGELPVDSLSKENVLYVRGTKSAYGRLGVDSVRLAICTAPASRL